MINAGSTSICRVCGQPLSAEPLLYFPNMPKAAQNFPDADSVAEDQGEDLDVRVCTACSLVQLTNPPVSYYRDVIRAAAFSPAMQGYREAQFATFAAEHDLAGKPVLEVGCGKGEFLSLIAAAGMIASGLENLEESVTACRDAGLACVQGYPDEASATWDGGPFDAFFIMNFFEHLPDPCTALAAIRNNLSDDAVGLVEVPNLDMIFESRLFSEFINDHLFYFTADTLSRTLAMNGFEVVSIESTWYDYILSAVVRKRGVPDVSGLAAAQSEITSQLEAWLARYDDRRVAIWGAGHQALAVLSLTGISNRIHAVLDSAPFKQDKLTPATHVPIVSPDAVASENIGAIIVMAASYSDEVAGIVRERFGDMPCAILRDHGLEVVSE